MFRPILIVHVRTSYDGRSDKRSIKVSAALGDKVSNGDILVRGFVASGISWTVVAGLRKVSLKKRFPASSVLSIPVSEKRHILWSTVDECDWLPIMDCCGAVMDRVCPSGYSMEESVDGNIRRFVFRGNEGNEEKD